MKVLTKEVMNDLDLFKIRYALDPKEETTTIIVLLDGCPKGVDKSDIKTVGSTDFLLVKNTLSHLFEDSKDSDILSEYASRLRVISDLPKDILKKVKDKRLLALGYANKETKEMIKNYTREKESVARAKFQESIEDSFYDTVGLSIERQFALHSEIYSLEALFDEAKIIGFLKKGKDLYIKLNNNETIVLTDVETLEEEINPTNTYVQLFELHKMKRVYELHLLLMARDADFTEHFYYATYKFSDMRFANNIKNFLRNLKKIL